MQAAFARPNPDAVIVLGKEKSGTTAIAALLAKHTGSTVTLDIPALFGRHMGAIRAGERDLEDVVRENRLEFSREIIKQPSMTWIYPEVRRVFPNARFVMITRDPRDNIRSSLNRMGLPGDLDELTAEHLRDVPATWAWHLDSPGLLGLRGDTYIELAARRWNLAADTYLRNREEMALIRYEDFVADKAGTISALASELGLRSVRDISGVVDRQYQPRGDRGAVWSEFFGVSNLAAIEEICGGHMRELRYATHSPRAGVIS